MDNDSNTVSSMGNKRNMKLLLPIVVIVLVVVLLGAFLFSKKTPSKVVPTEKTPLPHEVAVSLTEGGFEPSTVTIAKGSAVRWTNNTDDDHVSVNSADHPTHKKFPEMNLGEIPKGSTVVHIFNNPGTYSYHDHFHPDRTGTVVVQ